MITKYRIIESINKLDKYKVNEDHTAVVDRATNEFVVSLDDFCEKVRKDLHCNFDCIYSDHATLQVIYRCKECGTVIFASDDEFDYDPNLCCPTCGGYKTSLNYWTKEDIDSDIKKQNTIQWYADTMEWYRKIGERKERTGLWFNELWKKTIATKRRKFELTLKCDDAVRSGRKGMYLEISKLVPSEDDCWPTYRYSKSYIVPLSWKAFRFYVIDLPRYKRMKEK